jgi:hypothetical protein
MPTGVQAKRYITKLHIYLMMLFIETGEGEGE